MILFVGTILFLLIYIFNCHYLKKYLKNYYNNTCDLEKYTDHEPTIIT